MTISVFDLFKVSIGPSSSHTAGPMTAAGTFVRDLATDGLLERVAGVQVTLHGSLGLTGRGHDSDKAVLLGLTGEHPETVEIDTVEARLAKMRASGTVDLCGRRTIPFVVGEDLVFDGTSRLPRHPNGMRFTASGHDGRELRSKVYYSIGGGFVLDEDTVGREPTPPALPYPFTTAAQLLAHCRETGLPVSAVMMENEKALGRGETQIRDGLIGLWQVMRHCVRRGLTHEGVLPGRLRVRRRARYMYGRLRSESGLGPSSPMDWVSLYALAVNEENAAGGRIVTAPTNGAAGIIPAVLHGYNSFVPGAGPLGVVRFLLTAGAVGVLFKLNASISGAEVGCQGEVGSACAMAAAGLAEVLGGTPDQVESAAEIGIEHNLGLTCDPIGGLVQIPCIERNAVAAVKAVTAARIALHGDGRHVVSLDQAIATMRDTGRDMLDKYKETGRGGLAVNVVEC
ncbi:L-serine ammonia-lyase [Sphaerisporangium fuscum]|uniref:L-serine ammonia-lyase n=1 Tax=Sphaerisporangium fuscum TaxID=2835868 RepID=UPI001BDD3BA5|nr:L-serine ammonia-lyase [Sphaerisporangium fuscum]